MMNFISSYSNIIVNDGKTAFDIFNEYITTLDFVDKVIFVHTEKNHINTQIIAPSIVNRGDIVVDSVGDLFAQLCALDLEIYDACLWVYADRPFYHCEASMQMYALYKKYILDYVFAEGYPEGMCPEFVRPKIFSALKDTAYAGNIPLTHNCVFAALEKDINMFDIDALISPIDMRQFRIHFSTQNKRDYLVCKFYAPHVLQHSLLHICEYITNNQEGLRTTPAYISIQISNGCTQKVSYDVYPLLVDYDVLHERGYMAWDAWKTVIDDISTYTEDAVISMSPWGEPALHPQLLDMILYIEHHTNLTLYIETSGLGLLPIIEQLPQKLTRVIWIIEFDSIDPLIYYSVRGDGQQEAFAVIAALQEKYPTQVYVQAVRLDEYEEYLIEFYKYWSEKGNIIIQQYNNYAGFLPQRCQIDLSPLHRLPCWHVKRELHILYDGTVLPCISDAQRTLNIGNVFTDSIRSIWSDANVFYHKHLQEQYPSVCEGCNEYYTFNA